MSNSVKLHIAKGLSGVFHPLIMPLYLALVVLYAPSFAPFIPAKIKLTYLSIISFSFSLMPVSLLLILERIGKISSIDLHHKSERFIPMLLIMLCYFGGILFLQHAKAPAVLVLIMQGVGIAIMIVAIVSLLWKISAHATSIGGSIGICLLLAIIYGRDLSILCSAIVIIAGCVGWARLYLKCHTLSQVFFGYLTGFSAVLFTYAWHIYF